MTVSEFIKLWDSINISTIPTSYYYKGTFILKHKLYYCNETLHSINIKCNQSELKPYECAIVHSTLEDYNFDQQQFFDALQVQIPEGSVTYNLHVYIE